MDTEANQAQSSNAGQKNATSEGGNNSTPDMMTLLQQSSLPSSACNWISCLRKSGMSLTYSLEKQHVPDMDQPQGNSGGKQANEQSGNGSGSQSKGQKNDQSNAQGGASDTMTCSGTCSIRYFDLIVGGMLLLVACGILKGCRSMKRWL